MYNIPVIIPYIDNDEASEVAEVLKSGWVTQGTRVQEFERLICRHENVKYGVATTSCTTALHLALSVMGIGSGCDCILPSLTFVATPNAITYTGATPIFADVRTDTYNICIESLENILHNDYIEGNDGELVNKKSGNTLKAIIPVNLFGLCADLPGINGIAKRHGLMVIQDSACAFGAKINDRMQADFGNISCLSFHPRKSITTGEGGMILTNDNQTTRQLRAGRSHGASVSEISRHKNSGYLLPDFDQLGYNYRMTDIQAAIGIAQLRKFGYITDTRRKKAAFYNRMIKEMTIDFLLPPYVPDGYFSTFQSYVCMLDNHALGIPDIEDASAFRNNLMQKLESAGIATRVGTHATHMLGYYREKFGFKNADFPGAYTCDRLSITLPLYVQMTDDDQIAVLSEILKAKGELL